MQRTLIKQGLGGYTIYLPKRWVERQHLKPGGTVALEILDEGILVSQKRSERKLETSFKITTESESAIKTLITNAYRTGYDVVSVEFRTAKQFAILERAVTRFLIGYEIIERGTRSCRIENISEPGEEQFDVMAQKIHYNIGELIAIAEEYLQGRRPDSLEVVETNVLKYDNFCRRVIANTKVRDRKSEMIQTYLAILVHANRELYHMIRSGRRAESPLLLDLLREVRGTFEKLKQMFLKRDPIVFEEIHVRQDAFYNREGYDILQLLSGQDAVLGHHLMSALRQFYTSSSPLLGWLI